MAEAPNEDAKASDEKVPTWVYNAKGESKLIDLAKGAQAPKGWAFSPPSGVEVKVEGIDAPPPSPQSAPMPSSDPLIADMAAKIVDLTTRLETLEAQMVEIGEFLDAMTAPAAAPASKKRSAKAAPDAPAEPAADPPAPASDPAIPGSTDV